MEAARVEKLYRALRASGLTDLRTSEAVRRELVRLGAIPADPGPAAAYEDVRAALAAEFPTDEDWQSAHDELFRIDQEAMACWNQPGRLEELFPGYSPSFWQTVRGNTAFAMR